VVAELAPGVRATHGTFPRRNRIISGLADATIVVEAPARSGALITARHALEQGRALLVATGRPLDARVAGNLAMLRESPARPLVGLDEMIADLGFDAGWERSAAIGGEGSAAVGGHAPMAAGRAAPTLSSAGALALLEPTQRRVAAALAAGPRSVDALCRDTGLEPGVVAAGLTLLQLRGWARVLGATHLPAGPLLAMDRERGT
jgi:DNA processing protein